MAPVRRVAGADDGALVLVDATSGAGGLPVDISRDRRLLLRAAEVLRLRRRPVARGALARPRWSGPRRSARPAAGSRRSSTCRPRSTTRRKNQTYNTPSLATLFLMAEQLDWINGQGGLDFAVVAHDATAPAGSTAGRRRPPTPRRSSPTPTSARWSSARSTSTRASTPPRSPRPCAPTASSTPSPTASSAATSCGWRCSRRSTRPTSRRSPPASTTWSSASERQVAQRQPIAATRDQRDPAPLLGGRGPGAAAVVGRCGSRGRPAGASGAAGRAWPPASVERRRAGAPGAPSGRSPSLEHQHPAAAGETEMPSPCGCAGSRTVPTSAKPGNV